jgi:hypothetical protein
MDAYSCLCLGIRLLHLASATMQQWLLEREAERLTVDLQLFSGDKCPESIS